MAAAGRHGGGHAEALRPHRPAGRVRRGGRRRTAWPSSPRSTTTASAGPSPRPAATAGRIGTNPLCLGVPTASDPVVLDIGTSVCAEGKVRVAFNKGEPVPEGWLLDAEGQPTTDPGVLYREPRGTILPLGGTQAYKGFGIGLLLDMLVGGLSGRRAAGRRSARCRPTPCCSSLLRRGRPSPAPTTFSTRGDDPGRQRPRHARAAAGVGRGQLPGDPERRERTRRTREGVTLDEGTWGHLTDLARRMGVAVPT